MTLDLKHVSSVVHNEDCLKALKLYPDKYFDLAVVDPPYGININVSIGRRKGDKKSNYHKFAGNDSSIPNEKYFQELFRVSKNQIIWGGNYMIKYLSPTPCWLLWDKGFSEDVTFAQFEMAWTSFNSSTKKYDYNAAKNQNRIHPTQKPTSLYDWILQRYAKPNDLILDTHLGSGSSRIAAYKAGLNFVGFEIDAEYYEKQEKRFNDFKSQLRMF
jgi:site-specific DNA-methyltransferase (adenine-specific)